MESKPESKDKEKSQGSMDVDGKSGKKDDYQEDKELEEKLELILVRMKDPKEGVQKLALAALAVELTGLKSSVTGIPKSLKYIRKQYSDMKDYFVTMKEGENKRKLADIISVIGMAEETKTRESLEFKLRGNISEEAFSEWGHDYTRFIAGELANEYVEKLGGIIDGIDANREDESAEGASTDPSMDIDASETDTKDLKAKLQNLVDILAPYLLLNGAEPSACDLLLRIEQLNTIRKYAKKENYEKVTLYLMQCSRYLEGSDGDEVLRTVRDIFLEFDDYSSAMIVSIKLTDVSLMKDVFERCTDGMKKKQLALMIARQQLVFEVDDDDLMELMSNSFLSAKFKEVAKVLEIEKAKQPDDIFKSPDDEKRKKGRTTQFETAKGNLSKTFANAFANAGFGSDALLMENGPEWVFRNRSFSQMAAVASLGLILMWDIDAGVTEIDKYLYVQNFEKEYVIAGALLAIGIINSCVRSEFDPALNILGDHVTSKSINEQIGAIMGLGLAFAGTCRDDLVDVLMPILKDDTAALPCRVLAAHSIGLIFSGSGRKEIGEELFSVLETIPPADMGSCETFILFPLGLGYIYLSKKDEGQEMQKRIEEMEKAKLKDHKKLQHLSLLFEMACYAGNGHVLTVQRFLNLCSEHDEEDVTQPMAAIALSVVAIGEEIGEDMVMRFFDRLLQYSKVNVRRAVPLAIALARVSDPELKVMDILSKLSHDVDVSVASNAIIAIGIVGAGTNNARITSTLHQLATFHKDSAQLLFMVRLSQGLIALGKGTLTLDPLHSQRELINPRALSSLISVIFLVLQLGDKMATKYPYLFFLIAPAIYPKLLVAVDEDMKITECQVRVGNLVDIVGQAGHPKRITGFQTNGTPVVVNHREAAEMANDEFIALSSILEGFVIVKPNKDRKVEEDK